MKGFRQFIEFLMARDEHERTCGTPISSRAFFDPTPGAQWLQYQLGASVELALNGRNPSGDAPARTRNKGSPAQPSE